VVAHDAPIRVSEIIQPRQIFPFVDDEPA
jgi:hypothetical protein